MSELREFGMTLFRTVYRSQIKTQLRRLKHQQLPAASIGAVYIPPSMCCTQPQLLYFILGTFIYAAGNFWNSLELPAFALGAVRGLTSSVHGYVQLTQHTCTIGIGALSCLMSYLEKRLLSIFCIVSGESKHIDAVVAHTTLLLSLILYRHPRRYYEVGPLLISTTRSWSRFVQLAVHLDILVDTQGCVNIMTKLWEKWIGNELIRLYIPVIFIDALTGIQYTLFPKNKDSVLLPKALCCIARDDVKIGSCFFQEEKQHAVHFFKA